ncbi:MAG TPA: DUF192 domain-containing protein [Anaerolineaceae bacterium]|jgi:uncharacterized membrane protein (UPF0127 family)|nr:DUF192 domain-containing protein [Anaerolineaceae bacterium]
MPTLQIANQTHPLAQPIHAGVCDSFFTKLRGYMFSASIQPYDGLWFVEAKENRVDTTIHMFFMAFDLAVVWVDRNLRVVDCQYAQRWRPYYAPAQPAMYFLETHPDRLYDFQVGDQLSLTPCSSE